MKKVLDVFFGAPGTKPVAVLFCLLVAGFAEAISYGTLVPLIAVLAEPDAFATSSAFSAMLGEVLQRLDITPTLNVLIVIIVVALILKAFVSFAALAYAAYSKTRLITRLRRDLIAGLIAARWSYHADQRLGNIASVIASDTSLAGDTYWHSAQFLAALLQIFPFLCVSFLVSWQVTLFGIAVAALMFVGLRWLRSVSRRSGSKQQARTADLVALLIDTLSNIKSIKAMDCQATFTTLLSKKSRSVQRAMLERHLAKVGFVSAQDIISALAFGIGLYVAATWWQIPMPVLFGVGVLLLKLNNTFVRAHGLLMSTSETLAGYWRSLDMIAKTSAALEPDSGTLSPPSGVSIRFENVSFQHDSRAVLSEVNIDIPVNSITVLQGASGAGKTTLIDLLTGLHRPARGRILVGDTDLTRISLKEWRGRIGYVPQELSLLHASIADNITLGDASIAEDRIWRAIDLAGARDFIAALPDGLDADAGAMGMRLSGGQRQRIALARALVRDPSLLILDEVTSALDPETEREICARIQALGRRFTIIVITHRPAWTAIATKLYRVREGSVDLARAPDRRKTARQNAGKAMATETLLESVGVQPAAARPARRSSTGGARSTTSSAS